GFRSFLDDGRSRAGGGASAAMSERGPQIRSFTDAGRSAGPALRRPGVARHALLFTRIAGHALLLSRLAEHARLLARVAGFALAFFTSAVAFAGPKGHKVPDLRPDPTKTSRARGSTIQVP